MMGQSDTSAAAEICFDAIRALGDSDRIVVAIAGAPGSGKSTFGAALTRRLSDARETAVLVPMDGFHLDNAVLQERGLIKRKGAPETFDVRGFLSLVTRLRSGEEVIAPVFDRARDIAIAGAVAITSEVRVVVVEGNYLLLDENPWRGLADQWDLSIRIDVPMGELRSRLIQRWLNHGLGRTAAVWRAEQNDMPNAQRVLDHPLPADLTF